VSNALARLRYRSRDLLFQALTDRYWRRKLLGTLRCLLYHRVSDDPESGFLDRYGPPRSSIANFEQDLCFLRNQGARFFTLEGWRRGEWPRPDEFGVIISFDDGFREVYEHALPLLEAHGARAIVFQSSGMVDASELLWEHALYACWSNPAQREALLRRLQPFAPADVLQGDPNRCMTFLREHLPLRHVQSALAADEGLAPAAVAPLVARLYPRSVHLRAAQEAGHEIGSHGHLHAVRSALSAEEYEEDLRTSSATLQSLLGKPPRAYSYPFNNRRAEDRQVCARYFSEVATVDGGAIGRDADPLALPRINWPGTFPNAMRRRRWFWTGS